MFPKVRLSAGVRQGDLTQNARDKYHGHFNNTWNNQFLPVIILNERLIAKLFPETLKELTVFVQEETERFKAQEEYMRSIWADKTLITADFWFGLVGNTEQILKRYNVMLHRSLRVFSDQLFDGYNAIFLANCLIEYAERENCDSKLKEAIHLLFGYEKMIVTDINR